MAIITVTEQNYEELVLKAERPVLVDFWAPWCGYCRRIAPALEKVAEEREGDLVVAKINVDEEPELAQAFRVQSIPMLVLLRDNAVVAAAVGAQSKEQLEQKLGL